MESATVATKKIFKRKKAEIIDVAPIVVSEPVSDVFDVSGLVKEAKKLVKDVFAPKDEYEDLLTVSDWIVMPPFFKKLTGLPGLPCGLITMVYGKKDCGKTTLAIEALASAQRDGGIAILVDTENKFNLKRAKKCGLNVKNLVIISATTIEEAFDRFQTMVNLIKSKKEWKDRKITCVWDSLGATPCEAELDDNKTDFAMNAAHVIKGRLRKTLKYIRDTKTAFVIINQVYANTNSFGKKTTPYGGSGPEYHSTIILEFTRISSIRPPGHKSPDNFCGIETKIEVVKNHLGVPFRNVMVQIDHKGFVVGRDAEYGEEERIEKGPESESDPIVPERKKGRAKKKSKDIESAV